jgi:hypothetical protein
VTTTPAGNHPHAPRATFGLPVLVAALRRTREITITLVDNLDDLATMSGLPERPDGYAGLTSIETGEVYLDANSNDNELRATLIHELGHLVDPDATEEEVEMRTAEMLIPLSEALRAHHTGDHHGVAARCHVDTALVRNRVRGLLDAPTVRLPAQRAGGLEAVAG